MKPRRIQSSQVLVKKIKNIPESDRAEGVKEIDLDLDSLHL